MDSQYMHSTLLSYPLSRLCGSTFRNKPLALTSPMADGRRCGPRFKQQAAAAVADCLCDSAAAGHLPVLQALLAALLPPSGTLAGVAPALGPHMQRVYTTVAAAGQTAALNQLLVQLPDHADAFDHTVLEAALAAGHTATADVVCWLLALRYSPSELTALQQRSAGLASARLAGQLKAAAAAGDKEALAATLGSYVAQEEELLAAVRAVRGSGCFHVCVWGGGSLLWVAGLCQTAHVHFPCRPWAHRLACSTLARRPFVPPPVVVSSPHPSVTDPALPALLLLQAAAAGSMESAAVLVAPCTKQAVAPGAIMRALCMGACSSGQGLLLQSVALESPELQQHLRQDVGAVVDYLGAAALGGHATVAAWLLGQSLQPWAVLEAGLRVLLTQHRWVAGKEAARRGGVGKAGGAPVVYVATHGTPSSTRQQALLQQMAMTPGVTLIGPVLVQKACQKAGCIMRPPLRSHPRIADPVCACLLLLCALHRLKFLSPAAASNTFDTTRPSSSAPLTPGLLLQLVVAAERTQPSCTLPLPPDVVSLLLVVGGANSALSQHVCQLLGARSRSSTPSIASGSGLSREGSSCLPDVVALVRI